MQVPIPQQLPLACIPSTAMKHRNKRQQEDFEAPLSSFSVLQEPGRKEIEKINC
jgi:hypothetical protein